MWQTVSCTSKLFHILYCQPTGIERFIDFFSSTAEEQWSINAVMPPLVAQSHTGNIVSTYSFGRATRCLADRQRCFLNSVCGPQLCQRHSESTGFCQYRLECCIVMMLLKADNSNKRENWYKAARFGISQPGAWYGNVFKAILYKAWFFFVPKKDCQGSISCPIQ